MNPHPSQSTRAIILVSSNNISDASLVKRLLESEFEHVFTSTDPHQATADFDRHRPDVLVLAFNSLEKSEHHYLGLYRQGGAVLLHPHRTIVLCGKDEVERAYQLCLDGTFDDYILFWAMTSDAPRLRISVHLALRELTALAAPTTAEFVTQARRLETLEGLLNEQMARSEGHVNAIGQTVAQAGVDAGAAFDAFSKRLADGELPDVVEIKNAEGLRREMTHLKHDTIDAASSAMEKSVQPLKQWAGELREAAAPHFESIRALNVLANSAQQTVLVVDDDVFLHKIIGAALRDENYKLLFAASGTEAMGILRKTCPDLILMDVMMPDMNGLEVMRKIKTYSRFIDVPVLMITGKSEKDVVIESRKAGAIGFIVKPFTRELLLAKVKDALRTT
jgi:CheY-like chemotaxis protein